VGGAAFASKILKGSRPTEESASVAVVDVWELLQPKKKSKKAASKAKASGKRTAVSDAMENAEELMADVAEAEGCLRKRCWLDDLLTALINAAGLVTVTITTTAMMFMGKLTGMALRVPTIDVSVVDLTVELEK
ncbi:TDH1, partial [Symbiodinium necroappetens]